MSPNQTEIWLGSLREDHSQGFRCHPGGNPGANLKSIPHRCHPILVAFVRELTKETIKLPLGCLQGGLWFTFSSSYSSESAPSFCMNGAKCDWMFPSSSFARSDQSLPSLRSSTPLAPFSSGNHGWSGAPRVAKTWSYPMFSKAPFSSPVERRLAEFALEDAIFIMAAVYDPEAFQRAVPCSHSSPLLRRFLSQFSLKSIFTGDDTWRGLGALSLSCTSSLQHRLAGTSGRQCRVRSP